jgi:hypothetical protein
MVNLRRLINLLPFTFLVHNFEEAWVIGWMDLPEPFAVSLSQFIIAAIVLVAAFQVVGYLSSNWV